MTVRFLTDGTEVLKAERSLIRAAMGVVNVKGFAYYTDDKDQNIVLFPGSVKRLEAAISRLREARRAAKKRTRKFT